MKKTARKRHLAEQATPEKQPEMATDPVAETRRDLVPSPGTGPVIPTAGEPLFSEDRHPLRLVVNVVQGPITQVKAPVAVVGRYEGMPPAGSMKEFDGLLDCWLSRAVEFGMIGSGLGELFCLPLAHKQAAGAVAPGVLLVAGMGEPGSFGRDDLRYLMSNISLAIKALGHNEFSTVLLGSRRRELSVVKAVRALLEGTAEGLSRFPGAGPKELRILLVERPPESSADAIYQALDDLKDALRVSGLAFEVGPRQAARVYCPDQCDPPPPDLPPPEPTTRITITRVGAADDPSSAGAINSLTLQYAALAEAAVIPMREVEVQSYFAERLPARLLTLPVRHDGAQTYYDQTRVYQENFGKLLANYLVPEDFRKVIENGDALTLLLDAGTASYPWEMAAFKSHRETAFFGTDLKLTRQFRTLRSMAPGMVPPLNHSLRVLVIADPAPGSLHLDGARAEGLEVVKVLKDVQAAWAGELDLKVTVRIGAHDERNSPALGTLLAELRAANGVIVSAEPCDSLELLALIVNEAYDVVHYAGHGVFEPEKRQMGWVFDQDCVLSAQEIFRVRQVPRLVFANACHSGKIGPDVRRQQVGLAEAFFARGIHNYIGTGWVVDDALAQRFADVFYSQALGLKRLGGVGQPLGQAPPATLGDALAEARKAILHQGTTWGAYQHYGQGNAKLVAFPNRMIEEGASSRE